MKRCKKLKNLSIRFLLHGHKKKPIYAIIVVNRIACDKGKFVDKIGYFDPSFKERRFQIDSGRLAYWVNHGALVHKTVKRYLAKCLPSYVK